MGAHKQYDLQRFLDAQERNYDTALAEVKAGKKLSHWIWYIFPQLRGLGNSYNSNYYGIENIFEAIEYLSHPILGCRLREITAALLAHAGHRTAIGIFGPVDAIKVRSSMTLFSEPMLEHLSDDSKLFCSVLEKFYQNEADSHTLNLLYSGDEQIIYLSKDNHLQHIPIRDVVAIKYAEPGAMGSAGQVVMITSSGTLYVLETACSDMSGEEYIKICPLLKAYWEQDTLPPVWDNRYYMGAGNHLFIHESIVKDFDSRVKRFGLEGDLYRYWIMFVLDVLGKSK